jgi:LysM repeat protein
MNKYKITTVLAGLAIAGLAMTMTPLNAFANTGVTAAQSSGSEAANHSDRNFSTSKDTYKDSNEYRYSNEYKDSNEYNNSNGYIIAGPNDTLYDIAIEYDTTVSDLIYLNPQISNPNQQLYPGEMIIISNDNQWDNGLLNQRYSNGNHWGDKSSNQQNSSKDHEK